MNKHRVFMAAAVADLIHDECSKHPDTETGGTLVGYANLSHPTAAFEIVAATGPGPKASHSPSHFSPDVDYCNKQLRVLCQADDGLRVCGGWHKHPERMPVPSGQDVRQAQQILADPDYALDGIIVVIATGTNAAMRAFVLDKGDTHFEEVHMETGVETKTMLDPGAVAEEVRRLELGGWRADIRRTPDGSPVVRADRPDVDTRFTFVFPKDYPSSRPEILAQTRVPWPQDAGHLDVAASAIVGDGARNHARTTASVLDAMHANGLVASFLGEWDRVQTFALARPGQATAGFLVLTALPGQPEVYDAQMNRCHLKNDTHLHIWASDASKALGMPQSRWGRHWFLLVLLTLAAVVVITFVARSSKTTQHDPTLATPTTSITSGGAR